MPEELRDRLSECSRASGRSLHAEIISMLSASLKADVTLASAPTEDLIHELATRLGGRLELVITPEAARREGLVPLSAARPGDDTHE